MNVSELVPSHTQSSNTSVYDILDPQLPVKGNVTAMLGGGWRHTSSFVNDTNSTQLWERLLLCAFSDRAYGTTHKTNFSCQLHTHSDPEGLNSRVPSCRQNWVMIHPLADSSVFQESKNVVSIWIYCSGTNNMRLKSNLILNHTPT